MRTLLIVLVGACFGCRVAPGQAPVRSGEVRRPPASPEDCRLAPEVPASLAWEARLPRPDSAGPPLVLEGRLLLRDGRPAAGLVFYVYHTDATGRYPKRGDELGCDAWHGYVRGWVRTDAQGRYRFTTTRPATYPSRSDPAHVHGTIVRPGREDFWITDFVFEGDPLVTPAYLARLDTSRGGTGVVALTRRDDGTYVGVRDIRLPF